MQSPKQNIGLYDWLSKSLLPQNYLARIMVIAFVGTHLPLLALLVWGLSDNKNFAIILLVALCATLLGAAGTLYFLNGLLSPIRLVSNALEEYLDLDKMPELPTHYRDEVGRLMSNVQYALDQLELKSDTLQKSSGTDPLTQTYNRLSGNNALGAAIEQLQNDKIASIVVIDLDHLKRINDAYGHSFGDRALCYLADTIKAQIRTDDWIARWGGDEFVLVLFNLSPEKIRERLQVIKQKLRESHLITPDQVPLPLTYSAGISALRPTDTPNSAFERADQTLYRVKKNGRDGFLFTENTEPDLVAVGD